MNGITIRLATPADLESINDIYNHFVLNSTCTYQTEKCAFLPKRVRPQDDNGKAYGKGNDGGEEFAAPVALAMILSAVANISCGAEMQHDRHSNCHRSADDRDGIRQPVRHER